MPPIRPSNYTRKNKHRETPIAKNNSSEKKLQLMALLSKVELSEEQNRKLLNLEKENPEPNKFRLEYLKHIYKIYRDARKSLPKVIKKLKEKVNKQQKTNEIDELNALFKSVHISKEIKKDPIPEVAGLVASHLRAFERIKKIYYETYALCMTIKSQHPEVAAYVDDLLNKATIHFKNAILYITDITLMQEEHPNNIVEFPDTLYRRQVFLNNIDTMIHRIYYYDLLQKYNVAITPYSYATAERYTIKLLEQTIKDATVIINLLYYDDESNDDNNPAGARAEGGAPAGAGINLNLALGIAHMGNEGNSGAAGAGSKNMSNSEGGGRRTRKHPSRRHHTRK